MGLQTNEKPTKYVYGRGSVKPTRKQYAHGKGVLDIPIALFKQLLPSMKALANPNVARDIGSTAINSIKLAKVIKDIAVQPKPPKEYSSAEDVVKIIKGKGFFYSK